MSLRFFDHYYIFATIAFTVYGQLILKWRMVQLGEMPIASAEKLRYLLVAVFDPAIFSGFVAAFLASLAWMAAMTKFELSYAYPLMSLNFVIVLILSAWLLHEPVTLNKTIGIILIVAGTVIASRP
ncbi:EamA family transporter [Hydrogenophaga sp.]|jgi:uncharacterized membrane protein|uniref:EamA family transporter n=1 Tax=Hydrogenophaga sp. TaxID=1904254 RepID=UPI00271BB6CD|nr:EamA family transporter [Hydrogenophaga sp.]MDO9146198.1 EamA family transporter [Hydrogenophaga sp.]MDP3883879.1 EamA family transporter [Hydrogenophaga sp.]MDZ4263435.1 EamA family transporter [Pseudomonadota bacterium]